MAGDSQAGRRRAGRRPGGEDTREALISAALAEFARGGYTAATVRAIAARAGVDPAMINHYFGSKRGLFAAAVELPFDPGALLPNVLAGAREQLGARLVREFVRQWDLAGAAAAESMMRTAMQSQEATERLRTVFIEGALRSGLTMLMGWTQEARWRASLVASQLIGLLVVRYTARLEPLASASSAEVVTAIAPTLQRYLFGDVGDPPKVK